MIESAYKAGCELNFFSSSACAYNADLQKDPKVTALKESDANPAMSEQGYGWERIRDRHGLILTMSTICDTLSA